MYAQLIAQLEALAERPSQSPVPDGYWHMGVLTAEVRRIASRAAKSFRTLERQDQDQTVLKLLAQGSDEAAHLGACLSGKAVQDWPTVDPTQLSRMVRAFKGWSVTDLFCIEVLQPLLLRFPDEVLQLLAEWAEDENRWMRRASVVAFVRKIGASGRYTEEGIHACERLVWDSDDLVRKGVGWALKDLLQGDRARLLAYIRTLRQRGVPSTITHYALRRIQGRERQEILSIKPRAGESVS